MQSWFINSIDLLNLSYQKISLLSVFESENASEFEQKLLDFSKLSFKLNVFCWKSSGSSITRLFSTSNNFVLGLN